MLTQHTDQTANFVELYDLLMSEIEPDLMTEVMPLHEDMYFDESKEEKKERAERYAKALEECFRQVQAISNIKAEEIQGFAEEIKSIAKEQSGEEDKKALEELDEEISSETPE